MTNFSKCLYDLIDNADITRKDERIRENMVTFNISADDTVTLDNTLIAASRTACRVIGHKIDQMPPTLQAAAIRVLPGSVALNLMTAHEMLGAMLMRMPLELIGLDSPSDDCDCRACNIKRALIAEIKLVKED